MAERVTYVALSFFVFFLSGTGVKIRMRERERDRALTGLTLSGLKTRSILDWLRRFAHTGILSSSVEKSLHKRYLDLIERFRAVRPYPIPSGEDISSGLTIAIEYTATITDVLAEESRK